MKKREIVIREMVKQFDACSTSDEKTFTLQLSLILTMKDEDLNPIQKLELSALFVASHRISTMSDYTQREATIEEICN